ncbi:hypothetical protein BDY24DRAFT_440112 [Mrakia frigida]|uniref:uncharacterized protein n=1 Tax=Mrakia frigida TaxID=29902 RepID=UPI003FCC2397
MSEPYWVSLALSRSTGSSPSTLTRTSSNESKAAGPRKVPSSPPPLSLLVNVKRLEIVPSRYIYLMKELHHSHPSLEHLLFDAWTHTDNQLQPLPSPRPLGSPPLRINRISFSSPRASLGGFSRTHRNDPIQLILDLRQPSQPSRSELSTNHSSNEQDDAFFTPGFPLSPLPGPPTLLSLQRIELNI